MRDAVRCAGSYWHRRTPACCIGFIWGKTMAINTGTSRFTIGRTLGDSLKIFGRNFIVFAPVALAIRLLLLLVPQGQAAGMMSGASQINWFSAIVALAVAIIVTSATKAVMVFPTMQNLRGQKALVSDLWKSVPVLPAVIMAGAIFSLPSFVSLAVQGLFPGEAAAIGLSGFVVGVVALVLVLMWWLYAPTIAVERGGVLHGLRRSNYLLSGQRWRVFGLLVIVGVATSAGVIAIALLGGFSFTDLALLVSVPSTSPIGIALFILSAVISAFEGVLTTVSYYHLRVEKEGTITEDLVQVFD
jgi:hypothetical protein